jgi:hypothetical protein
MTQYEINSVYSFDLHAAGILGSSYKNVTVRGMMNEASAIRAGCATREIHAQVFSQLPIGTPNNPAAYTYVEFETSMGETLILGMPWIKEDSVQKILSNNYNVKVGGISPTDLPRLRNALLTSGFKTFEIELAE